MSTLTAPQLKLPDFDQISIEDLRKQTLAALSHAQSVIDSIGMRVMEQAERCELWRLLMALECAENAISLSFGLLSHLNSVKQTPEIREIYNQLLPQLTAFYTAQGQNQQLYQAFKQVSEGAVFNELEPAQQYGIILALRDFKLSGVALEGAERQEYARLAEELSQLSSTFSDHLLDATQAYIYPLSPEALKGIPGSRCALLQQLGKERGLNQPAATLDAPAYQTILTYAEDRALRERIYRAYGARASEFGPAEQDNGPLMVDILAKRQRMAQLLGFADYATLSLATKMASSIEEVTDFLKDLALKAKPFALKELEDLQALASDYQTDPLQPWDVPFLSEKLRQQRFNLSQEDLKPYFPAPKVIEGLFEIAARLFNIQIKPKVTSVWDKYVQYYEIYDHDVVIGGFYFDLYARSDKRGGAWMKGYQSRFSFQDDNATVEQWPIAFMVANFAPPVGSEPALLTHDELITLFHEFGHGLHHLLTKINVLALSGVQGVAWDAVELPSQLLEFWTWEREALSLISAHHTSGEPLPQALLDALLSARHFQTGLQTLRQVEFALVDLALHAERPAPNLTGIGYIIDLVRQQMSVLPPPPDYRFQHGFSHIFAGGYAAGYYSYKWAEVLASDVFEKFEEEGIFNAMTGQHFKAHILEKGGSRPAAELFADFRGRAPSLSALLRHNGWTNNASLVTQHAGH